MGATIPQQFSDSFIHETFYKITGTYAASQFPDIASHLVRLKAPSTNTGSIFIGHNGTSLWWELDAGDDTGWISVPNLNRYWHGLSSGSADYLVAWVQG